jgi:hypothetical protein
LSNLLVANLTRFFAIGNLLVAIWVFLEVGVRKR